MDPTSDDIRSLGAKLDALDLTEGEAVALDALVAVATGAETAGFAAGYGDRLAGAFGAGFTAPGDVAGFTAPGDVAGRSGRRPSGPGGRGFQTSGTGSGI